jgi:hypothetical protein
VALEIDVEGATRRQRDATSGRPTALHFFSDELPFRGWAKSWLAEQKTAPEVSSLFDVLEAWDLAAAYAAIRDWAGPAPLSEVVGDGLRLGGLTHAEVEGTPDLLLPIARALAASYVGLNGTFRVPYFDLQA